MIYFISVFSVDVEQELLKLAVARAFGLNEMNSFCHQCHDMIIFEVFCTEKEFNSIASLLNDFFLRVEQRIKNNSTT